MIGGWEYLILSAVGVAAGVLNVLAGGGTLLTVPTLIFLGLPPGVANGTNRIAIVAQNAGAVWRFHRHGLMERSWLTLAALPAVAGVALGTWFALRISDDAFQRVFAITMIVVALWTIADPLKKIEAGGTLRLPTTRARWLFRIGFFVAGVYGGFVQAGVGFLILALVTAAGLDLVRGNALKVLVVLCYTPLALILFAIGGQIEWWAGLALAAGNLTGALLGVRLAVLRGHVWIKRVVTITVVAVAIRLWFGS